MYTYFPQVPLTPVTEQYTAEISFLATPALHGIQASWAPFNRFNFGISSDFGILYTHGGIEFGAGFYYPLHEGLDIGIYSGAGITGFHIDKNCPDGDCTKNFFDRDHYTDFTLRQSDQIYNSYFVEPYISLNVESIKINLGVKINTCQYPDFYVIDSYSQKNLDGNTVFLYSDIYEKPDAYISTWQPFTSLSMHDEIWKISVDASFVNQISTNVSPEYMRHRKNYVAVGLTRKF